MVGCVIAFAAGIWVVHDGGTNGPFITCLAGLFFAVVLYGDERVRKRKHERKGILWLFLLCLLAGMARMESAGQETVGSVREYEGAKVTVHGKISGDPVVSSGMPGEWRAQYKVVIDRIIEEGKSNLPQAATGGVLLNVRMKQPGTEGADGDTVTASGTIRLMHGYNNPGQPDWAAMLSSQGIEARISALSGRVKFIRGDDSETYFCRLVRWRRQVRSVLMENMPDQEAAVCMGMLFGGYEGIERQTVRDFASTGIVHILSVSGAHIALVAGSIFWMARRLSVPESWSSGISALAMLGYGMVSGFSAPVTRSVIMGLIAMAALGTGRLPFAPGSLSLAAFGMLIYEPRNLFDIGFQLSIGCTAGLLYLYPVILKYLKGVLQDWFAEGIASTVAAQLAVLPFLSWYFGSVSIISLFANILVVPILEGSIVLGLFGIILTGGFASMSGIVFTGIGFLIGAAVSINQFLAGVPGGMIFMPAMGIGGGCLYYGLILWIFGYCKQCLISPAALFGFLYRKKRLTAVFCVLASVGILWLIMRPGPLEVHFIDVGQGDATLIVTPHGRAIMVDAGGSIGTQNGFDVGERVVVPYLRHYGVNSVEWLILTHNHLDHSGGAPAVARIIGVHHVLMRLEDNDIAGVIIRLKQAMHDRGILAADSIEEIQVDGVQLKLFQIGEENPAEKAKEKEAKSSSSSSENGKSTVVRIVYGSHSFLLTGDLEGESEMKLSKQNLGFCTVLKVGHHGARKSSQPEFLARISPQFAVISVGADNRFGHPNPETVTRLKEWPLSVFRTDRHGAVVFRSDGENLTVERSVR